MRIGMLWFDNDPKTDLAQKVGRAAGYYLRKYGLKPTTCFVHPSMLLSGPSPARVDGIEMRSSRQVLPSHFWMGVEEEHERQA